MYYLNLFLFIGARGTHLENDNWNFYVNVDQHQKFHAALNRKSIFNFKYIAYVILYK